MRVHLYTSLCCLVVLSTLADTDVFLYSFLTRTDFGVEPLKETEKYIKIRKKECYSVTLIALIFVPETGHLIEYVMNCVFSDAVFLLWNDYLL